MTDCRSAIPAVNISDARELGRLRTHDPVKVCSCLSRISHTSQSSISPDRVGNYWSEVGKDEYFLANYHFGWVANSMVDSGTRSYPFVPSLMPHP